jgi:RNA recognition motif-containing protein
MSHSQDDANEWNSACSKAVPPFSRAAVTRLDKRRSASMKIYVGNLPSEVTEQELREEFATFGEVASVNIIKDKYTGHPRGFGFVEMTTVSQGQAAIAGLNGKALKDQALTVNAARPPSGNRGGGSSGNRRGGWSGRGRQSRY